MSTARDTAKTTTAFNRIMTGATLLIAPLAISIGAAIVPAIASADAGTGTSPNHSSVLTPQHHRAFPNQTATRPAPGSAGRHNPQHEANGHGGNSHGQRRGHHA